MHIFYVDTLTQKVLLSFICFKKYEVQEADVCCYTVLFADY